MQQDDNDRGDASSPSFFTSAGGDGGPANIPGRRRGTAGVQHRQGGSNCSGRQHCIVEVKKEGDDASPLSLSALDRLGGEEERGAVVVGSFKFSWEEKLVAPLIAAPNVDIAIEDKMIGKKATLQATHVIPACKMESLFFFANKLDKVLV